MGLSSLEPSPFGDDSTTAIFDEDDFFVISEERLTRIKHDGGYPSSSIQLCLNENNSTISDIDSVVVGFGLEKKYMGQQMNEKFCSFAKDSGFRKTSLERKNPIFYDHQYIHARTGFALSGFKKAIAICLDAGGMDTVNVILAVCLLLMMEIFSLSNICPVVSHWD